VLAVGCFTHLTDAKISLNLCCPARELASEAAALLDEHEQKIRSEQIDSRARKSIDRTGIVRWGGETTRLINLAQRSRRTQRKTRNAAGCDREIGMGVFPSTSNLELDLSMELL